MTSRPPIPEDTGHTESELVLPEGVEAGLVGGTAVALAFLVRDLLLLGEWLHTPSVLGVLLLEGPQAARETVSAPAYAGLYHAAHYAVWIAVGFAGSALARAAERDRRRRTWLLGLLAAVILPFLGLELAVPGTGLGRSHLTLGAVLGAFALAGYLVWRHPAALRGS